MAHVGRGRWACISSEYLYDPTTMISLRNTRLDTSAVLVESSCNGIGQSRDGGNG